MHTTHPGSNYWWDPVRPIHKPFNNNNNNTFLLICREIRRQNEQHKNVAIMATTGMARLQFMNGMTIHNWSGYGDGHIPTETLIGHILTQPGYATTKE